MTTPHGRTGPDSEEAGSSEERDLARIEFDDDDDLLPEDDDDYVYSQHHGFRVPRPEWLHPECVDTFHAFEYGSCCMYPADVLVRGAVHLADAVDGTLTEFDCDGGDCAQTASQLGLLIGLVPALVSKIRATLPAADRTATEQLLCPVGRLTLLVLELSLRSGCPMACTVHGAADRRAVIAPFASVLEECQDALHAAVAPRPPQRQRT